MSGAETKGEARGEAAEPGEEPVVPLSDIAMRALKEAEERRAQLERAREAEKAKAELGGRSGPDPVRYGDWENGGIASDF